MTPEPWPLNAQQRKEWVATLVRDIDYRCSSGRPGLLSDLLRTAWPTWTAQDQ